MSSFLVRHNLPNAQKPEKIKDKAKDEAQKPEKIKDKANFNPRID